VKTKTSWRNKKGRRGENKSIVPVQTFFTPILKAEKQFDKTKLSWWI
jgi:hypothetical protein